MENDNKELKEETTKKEADKKETESKEETKQPVEETAVQKKKSKKWIGIVAAVVAVILLAYGGVAIYYQSHFLNHTYINNSDCSNMTATEVAAIMDQQSQQYSLQILGRDGGRLPLIQNLRKKDWMCVSTTVPLCGRGLT